jgi:hypothetical protein
VVRSISIAIMIMKYVDYNGRGAAQLPNVPRLNEDIVHLICQDIVLKERPKTWLSVSRVCKTWHAAVTPLLYRRIDFAAIKNEGSFHYFMRTIAEQPQRAQHVLALNFSRTRILTPRPGQESLEEPVSWDLALNEVNSSAELRQQLEQNLMRRGAAADAAKIALLLLLCINLSRIGLTDDHLVIPHSPLFKVLEIAKLGSPLVLTKLVSLDLEGSGLVHVEKLVPFFQLPNIKRLALFNIADASTKLLGVASSPMSTVRRFHYSPMAEEHPTAWYNNYQHRPLRSEVLKDIFKYLPCVEHLSFSLDYRQGFWTDLLNAFRKHRPPLKNLGIDMIGRGELVGIPNLQDMHSLLALRINYYCLFDGSPGYNPGIQSGPLSRRHLSEILPLDLEYLHCDSGSSITRGQGGTTPQTTRRHTDQILQFLSDPEFTRLRSVVVENHHFGVTNQERHLVPKNIKEWAKNQPWHVWTWQHGNNRWYLCFEKQSVSREDFFQEGRMPSGPFIYP